MARPRRGRRSLREGSSAAVALASVANGAADENGERARPHFLGHRERLRTRFLEGGAAALADYELLELILFAIPRVDVKPLAKELIAKFGSFAEAIAAEPQRLPSCSSTIIPRAIPPRRPRT